MELGDARLPAVKLPPHPPFQPQAARPGLRELRPTRGDLLFLVIALTFIGWAAWAWPPLAVFVLAWLGLLIGMLWREAVARRRRQDWVRWMQGWCASAGWRFYEHYQSPRALPFRRHADDGFYQGLEGELPGLGRWGLFEMGITWKSREERRQLLWVELPLPDVRHVTLLAQGSWDARLWPLSGDYQHMELESVELEQRHQVVFHKHDTPQQVRRLFSPAVIERVLDHPEVADIPISVCDGRLWLVRWGTLVDNGQFPAMLTQLLQLARLQREILLGAE